MSDLNAEGLGQLGRADPYHELFEKMASRQKGRAETTVEVVVKWLRGAGEDKNARRKAIEFLRQLERLGGGRVVVGRGGASTRFHWYADMREVARLALEKRRAERAGAPPASPSRAPDRSVMMRHAFPLRADLMLPIDLPRDLTLEEAERLARFVLALPVQPARTATAARIAASDLVGIWRDRRDLGNTADLAERFRAASSTR